MARRTEVSITTRESPLARNEQKWDYAMEIEEIAKRGNSGMVFPEGYFGGGEACGAEEEGNAEINVRSWRRGRKEEEDTSCSDEC